MSILEISHRSKTFEVDPGAGGGRHPHAGQRAGELQVLFLQGGASLQFSMVPMNLLPAGATADYIDGGSWADKAIKEARKVGTGARRRLDQGGRATRAFPGSRARADAGCRLRPHDLEQHHRGHASTSSFPRSATYRSSATPPRDMFSRPIDVGRHALIYAGAQKNMGPAGVTVVIIRDDLLERAVEKKASLPTMLNYAVHAENRSLYNTPPVFAVYALGLVMKWLLAQGGLAAIGGGNERKAATALRRDRSHRLLSRHGAQGQHRSLMNVTFRLATEELETAVREGVDGGRPRRPERPSRGRRHARLDLQRVSRRRRGRACRVHEGVRTRHG